MEDQLLPDPTGVLALRTWSPCCKWKPEGSGEDTCKVFHPANSQMCMRKALR